MEDKRVFASIGNIEQNLTLLSQHIRGIPIEFIFNCEEMGEQAWANAQVKTLIVQAGYPYEYAPYPVNRSWKRASALVAINPLGMAGIPQFAVPRENLDSEIYQILHKSFFEAVHTKKVTLPRVLLNIGLKILFYHFYINSEQNIITMAQQS